MKTQITKNMWDLEKAVACAKEQGMSVKHLAQAAILEGNWPFAEKIHKAHPEAFKGIPESAYETGCVNALWGGNGGGASNYYCEKIYQKFTGKSFVWTKEKAHAAYLACLEQGNLTWLAEITTNSGIKPDWKKLEKSLREFRVKIAVEQTNSTINTAESVMAHYKKHYCKDVEDLPERNI